MVLRVARGGRVWVEGMQGKPPCDHSPERALHSSLTPNKVPRRAYWRSTTVLAKKMACRLCQQRRLRLQKQNERARAHLCGARHARFADVKVDPRVRHLHPERKDAQLQSPGRDALPANPIQIAVDRLSRRNRLRVQVQLDQLHLQR